jgi:uncharacterized membrane protein YfcA
MNPTTGYLIGLVTGAIAGGVLAYYAGCNGVTWGVLGSLWSGAIFGAVIGMVIAHAIMPNRPK